MYFLFALVLSCFVSVNCSFADVIRTVDGQVFEGDIEKKSDGSVFIKMDSGSFSLPESLISSVEDSTASEKQNKDVADSQSPKSNAELRKLRKTVAKVRTKKILLSRYQREKKTLSSELKQKEYDLRRAYNDYDSNAEQNEKYREKYGARGTVGQIQRVRAVQSQMRQAYGDAKQLEIDCKEISKKIDNKDYQIGETLQAIDRLTLELKNQYATVYAGIDQQNDPLASQVKNLISDFEGSWSNARIQLVQRGNAYYARALVNGVYEIEFHIDTGCSSVLISESIAREIGINIERDSLGKSYAIIADGSKVESHVVEIKSIDLGGMIVKDVEACVLPGKENASNLLGMEYFKHFFFQIDNNRDMLFLEKYDTE